MSQESWLRGSIRQYRLHTYTVYVFNSEPLPLGETKPLPLGKPTAPAAAQLITVRIRKLVPACTKEEQRGVELQFYLASVQTGIASACPEQMA